MKNLLCGKEIVKSFGEGSEKTRVLNQVSLEVERGEYLSVMGPSGSGKSTLLYALSGMDIIDSGSVSLDGLELSGLRMRNCPIFAGGRWDSCFSSLRFLGILIFWIISSFL